jgi:hypothetical protein
MNLFDPLSRAAWVEWPARLAVGAVFVMNVWCALAYLGAPDAYAAGYGLSGYTGRAVVRGFAILFLMWNATYPPVIWQPRRHTTLFAIVLVQQLIGLVGEVLLLRSLPAEGAALRAIGTRFVVFDGGGLVLMLAAFTVMRLPRARG